MLTCANLCSAVPHSQSMASRYSDIPRYTEVQCPALPSCNATNVRTPCHLKQNSKLSVPIQNANHHCNRILDFVVCTIHAIICAGYSFRCDNHIELRRASNLYFLVAGVENPSLIYLLSTCSTLASIPWGSFGSLHLYAQIWSVCLSSRKTRIYETIKYMLLHIQPAEGDLHRSASLIESQPFYITRCLETFNWSSIRSPLSLLWFLYVGFERLWCEGFPIARSGWWGSHFLLKVGDTASHLALLLRSNSLRLVG